MREGSRKPGLPLKPDKCGTITHDYKRNGTTTLFAALSAVEREVPAGKLIHVVLDNYGTHKHQKIMAWLERHPRWIFHFTPTSGSWLNAVENFFSTLTRQRLKRGVFHSVVDLQTAIKRYIDEHNDDPKPFT